MASLRTDTEDILKHGKGQRLSCDSNFRSSRKRQIIPSLPGRENLGMDLPSISNSLKILCFDS